MNTKKKWSDIFFVTPSCLKAQRLIQFHGLSVPVETIYSVFANGTTQGIVLNLNPHHFNGRRVQISSPIL